MKYAFHQLNKYYIGNIKNEHPFVYEDLCIKQFMKIYCINIAMMHICDVTKSKIKDVIHIVLHKGI